MTKTRTILVLSLAAIFAVSMIASQNVVAVGGSHLDIVESKVEVKTKNGEQTLKVEIKTGDKIPKDGSSDAFGYGIFTGTNVNGYPENVLALTTHLCVSDSFNQGNTDEALNCPFDAPHYSIGLLEVLRDEYDVPFEDGNLNQENDGSTFHAHVLDLIPIASTSDCFGEGDFEVDVERTLDTLNNISPDWKVKVKHDKISIKKVATDELSDAGVEEIHSFTIVPKYDGENVTNLCLTVTG